MRECKCGNKIPTIATIDGKKRNLINRKFCFDCVPFNSGKRGTILFPKKVSKETRKKNNDKVTLHRQRKKQFLIDFKGGKCQICGYNKKCPAAYDFHHRNPDEKEFGLGNGLTKSLEKLLVEVAKCDLICRNCHSELHYGLGE